jgi:hypothetical protein
MKKTKCLALSRTHVTPGMAAYHLARRERPASGPAHEVARHPIDLIPSRAHSPHPSLAIPARRQPVLVPPASAQTSMDQVHGARTPTGARGPINKLWPLSLPLFSFAPDPKTWGRLLLVVGCSARVDPSIYLSQWHFGNCHGPPRQALGRHRRRPAARLRPRPPPQARRPPAAVKINGDRRCSRTVNIFALARCVSRGSD